ncbi:Uncharacterized protein Adt_00360 [Abeliophyllum distichum]|uniref:Uncharacterized protein n=1 Tax=Abeliophyllum distichum TaxID=126358 RepID=A0ABD1VPU9_9LAMI
MKKSYLACIFILFSAQLLLSSLALEYSQKLQQENHSTSRKFNYHAETHVKEFVAKHDIIWTEKGQKGKGSYGGANVVHRRPQRNEASLLYRPSLIMFTMFFWLTIVFA